MSEFVRHITTTLPIYLGWAYSDFRIVNPSSPRINLRQDYLDRLQILTAPHPAKCLYRVGQIVQTVIPGFGKATPGMNWV